MAWIFLNDGFFSIVEDKLDPESLVVRARVEGDIERVFRVSKKRVKVTTDSDYRFRVNMSRQAVAQTLAQEVKNIDYTNFKDSVKDNDRARWYTKVWHVMFDWQESLYEIAPWWKNYKYRKEAVLHQDHYDDGDTDNLVETDRY